MELFWSKVDIKGPDDCWEWIGPERGMGYGSFSIDNKTFMAHRFAWILSNEKRIPRTMVIMHMCDNPPCCNPNHLKLGTMLDNARDRDKKGRRVDWQGLKTHCKRGHEFTKENTIYTGNGKARRCKICTRAYMKEYDRKRRKKPKALPSDKTNKTEL